MDENLKSIRKLVKFMKNEGVLKIKRPDFELELSPSALFPETTKTESTPQTQNSNPTDRNPGQLTDEELMMWSSPGYVPQGGPQ